MMRFDAKLILMLILSFAILNSAFADPEKISFDDSTCIILSDGPMPKLSIPVPSAWTNAYNDPDMSEQVRKDDIENNPLNDTLAHFFNPDAINDEAFIQVSKNLRKIPISDELYKSLMDMFSNEFGQGKIDNQKFKDSIIPGQEEILKTMRFLPIHVKDDKSLQVSMIFPVPSDEENSFGVGTLAFVRMQQRVFMLIRRTQCKDKTETDEQVEITRAFVKEWIEAISRKNEGDANNIPADSDKIQFDKSNCITLTSGTMPHVSIPSPSGWINGFDMPALSEAIKKKYVDSDPKNEIPACYFNPNDFGQEATIKVPIMMSKLPMSREIFTEMQNGLIDKIKAGTLLKSSKIRLNEEQLKMLNEAKYFPDYVNDDNSLQFTIVIPSNSGENKSFVLVSEAVLFIHQRIFMILVKTNFKDETKIMEQVEKNQSFIRQWIEAIYEANGIVKGKESVTSDENDSNAPGHISLPPDIPENISLPAKKYINEISSRNSFERTFVRIVTRAIVIGLITGIVYLFKRKN